MKKIIILFIFFLLPLQLVFSQVPQEERDALISLYNATDGRNWKYRTLWSTNPNSTSDVSNWYGIKVEKINGQDHVTEIDLSRNNLSGTLPDLTALSKLKYIWLYDNKLNAFQEGDWNLSNLEYLNIENNELTNLPLNFGKITSLRIVLLKGNLIASLPESIGDLTSLNTLDLENNKITTIPASIGNCTDLAILKVSHSGLQSFQPAINNIRNIRTLQLDFIKDGDIDLSNMPSISSLAITNSKIRTIKLGTISTDIITDLKTGNYNLTCLEVSNSLDSWKSAVNKAVQNSKLFGGVSATTNCSNGNTFVPELERIAIQKIFALDESTQEHVLDDPYFNLGTFSDVTVEHNYTTNKSHIVRFHKVSGNLVGDLPNEIKDLKELSYLHIDSENPSKWHSITSIPIGIGDLSKLKKLIIKKNRGLQNLPESFGNLKEIDSLELNGIGLTSLPESFGNLSKVKHLNLSNNYITELPQSFGGLTALTYLNLSNNRTLKSILGLENFTKLITLDASQNSIKNLTEDILPLEKLEYLYANDNLLETLPNNLNTLLYLKKLQLQNNQIKGGLDLFDNQLLTHFNIKNNKIERLVFGTPKPEVKEFLAANNPYLRCMQVSGAWLSAWNNNDNTLRDLNPGLLFSDDCSKTIMPEKDRLALRELFYTADGPNWIGDHNWDVSDKGLKGNLYNWAGLSFEYEDYYTRKIDEIRISGSGNSNMQLNLKDLAEVIKKFDHFLSTLGVSHINIGGEIPEEYGNIKKLKILGLALLDLEGEIPENLVNNNLKELNLAGNKLSGKLPDFHLSSTLEELNLTNNQFQIGDVEDNFLLIEDKMKSFWYRQDPIGEEETIYFGPGGATVTLTADVNGTDNIYRWYYKRCSTCSWDRISTTTEKTITLNIPDGSEAQYDGYYYCRVTNDLVKERFVNRTAKIHLDYDPSLSIEKNEFQNMFQLYPNPVKNALEIKNPSNIFIEKIEIYTLLGAKIKSINKEVKTIDVYKFSKGIYLLKIYTEQGKAVKRFIKN